MNTKVDKTMDFSVNLSVRDIFGESIVWSTTFQNGILDLDCGKLNWKIQYDGRVQMKII